MSQWEQIKSKPGITNIPDIVALLTPSQQQCILALTEEWKSFGYSRTDADQVYATDNIVLPGRFEPLVDCRYHRQPGISPSHQHRLFPLGLAVKAYLEKNHV